MCRVEFFKIGKRDVTFIREMRVLWTYLIYTQCAFIYFQEKSCPVRPYSIVVISTMSALCIFFGKIPCPVRLFHTVQLLDNPECAYLNILAQSQFLVISLYKFSALEKLHF